MKSVQICSFFRSVFSRVRTEYGDLLRESPYSVRMWEHTDQKKLRIWTLFTQWYTLTLSIHMDDFKITSTFFSTISFIIF